MASRLTVLTTTRLIALALLGPAAWTHGAESRPSVSGCNFDDAPDQSQSLNDYRTHDRTAELRWAIADIKRNHLDPAMNNMRRGIYARGVIVDLAFMLNHWPNHYQALQALIKYDLGGGKSYDFPSTECWLGRAREFSGDDPNLSLIEGYYYWKKGATGRALDSYQEALRLNPSSAEAHYNLGLLYFQMSQYEKSNEHAQAAYTDGYPLPGLREKLEKSGHWEETPPPEGP